MAKTMPVFRYSVSGEEEVDSYTASIELSNTCRQVYLDRRKNADIARKRLNLERNTDENYNNRKKTTIDHKMELLRKEMSSLIDQDLALMKQLLTLNETIEDLKWQRRYASKNSFDSSSYLVDVSCSCEDLNETEDLDEDDWQLSASSPPCLSLVKNSRTKNVLLAKAENVSSKTSCSVHAKKDSVSKSEDKSRKHADSDLRSSSVSLKTSHGEQSSVDSGIHEPDTVSVA
ncbi:uncharacterized protein LOC106172043 [Lingula anatina]|uniref:Uncharacterized protein LOC106172043 n=1 Tax=Lingula anatina TaxID=7574 RepID=A0A1S3JCM8_LINAN|nr:uncharacterized protein LOC106172043 [Lingula anatina]|eukprot:XP_013408078.1 uncharacterized protein LOC106172043 [Lingula anatina]